MPSIPTGLYVVAARVVRTGVLHERDRLDTFVLVCETKSPHYC